MSTPHATAQRCLKDQRNLQKATIAVVVLAGVDVALWIRTSSQGVTHFNPSNVTLKSAKRTLMNNMTSLNTSPIISTVHNHNLGNASAVRMDTAVATATTTTAAATANNVTCVWSNTTEHDCIDLTVQQFRRHYSASQRRWLFLGDSTISHLFGLSLLAPRLDARSVPCATCTRQYAQRCNMARLINMPDSQGIVWVPPNMSRGEGPVDFGLHRPYCHDCSGCNSCSHECQPKWPVMEEDPACRNTSVWGGYLAV
jgi:hypothetical protein